MWSPRQVDRLARLADPQLWAEVRRFLPELLQLICDRKINPGKVFDLKLPLEEAAEGYRAMDQRRAIKVLLTV
jgi:threonine dehydrogenase-like Zn-dependent dehydrogenase